MRYRTKSAKKAAKAKAQNEWRDRQSRKTVLVKVPVSKPLRRLMVQWEWIQEGEFDDRAEIAKAIVEALEELARK